MPGLKYYYDLMSQPCRALYIFLRMNNISYEDKTVALRKGEHMTDEFTKLNPFQRVPVIDDDGFILTESVAILKYLCATRNVASHWYPTEVRHRARVDEYLSWQHTNTRLFGSMVFRTIHRRGIAVLFQNISLREILQRLPLQDLPLLVAILRYLCRKHGIDWYPTDMRRQAKVDEYLAWHYHNTSMHAGAIYELQVIEPRAKQIPVDQEKLRSYRVHLEKTLGYIEDVYLKDHLYLCGDDITIADLLGVCELMQPMAAGEDIFKGHDKLKAYVERVQGRLQPHFDESHKMVYKLRDLFSQAKM